MTRRFAILGVLVILSQMSTGCYGWRPFACWRPLCHPCAPACPISACSSPVVGHPVLRPGCAPCATSGGMGIHPGGPGVPTISNPIPFGQGPMIYQGEELGKPTPVNPQKNN